MYFPENKSPSTEREYVSEMIKVVKSEGEGHGKTETRCLYHFK